MTYALLLAFVSLGTVALAALIAGALGRLQDHRLDRHHRLDSSGPAAAQRGRLAPRERGTAASASAPIRAMPTTRSATPQALRATGQRAQAAAVLRDGRDPQSRQHEPLLGAYGRALADAGNFKQALDVLERAHSPDQPDWRILSVQGAVLDQMGRHEEAQRYYASALKIMPDEPSVLSNLGLSYALSKDLQARRGDAAPRRRARQRRPARAAESRARGRPAGPLRRRPRRSRAPTCRRTRRPRTSPICAADAGAAEDARREDDSRAGRRRRSIRDDASAPGSRGRRGHAADAVVESDPASTA